MPEVAGGRAFAPTSVSMLTNFEGWS
jgi:hypothetical protein